MAVDRYTKLLLTVIAVCLVCLVWLSTGGPSLITPVSAQVGDRVILAGWMDEKGVVRSFPQPTWAQMAERQNLKANLSAADGLPTANTR